MECDHIVLFATPFAALLQHDIFDRNGYRNRTKIRQPPPRATNGFLTITCPHCGEDFETTFDPGEGGAQFVIDCEVCCCPISVTVRVRSGRIDDVQVAAS